MKRVLLWLAWPAVILLVLWLPFAPFVPIGTRFEMFVAGVSVLLLIRGMQLLRKGTVRKPHITGLMLFGLGLMAGWANRLFWPELPYLLVLPQPVVEGIITEVERIPADSRSAQNIMVGDVKLLKYGFIVGERSKGDRVRVEYLPHSRIITRWNEGSILTPSEQSGGREPD